MCFWHSCLQSKQDDALIIKGPWIIVRLELDNNLKYKAKETVPAEENLSNDGWARILWHEA